MSDSVKVNNIVNKIMRTLKNETDGLGKEDLKNMYNQLINNIKVENNNLNKPSQEEFLKEYKEEHSNIKVKGDWVKYYLSDNELNIGDIISKCNTKKFCSPLQYFKVIGFTKHYIKTKRLKAIYTKVFCSDPPYNQTGHNLHYFNKDITHDKIHKFKKINKKVFIQKSDKFYIKEDFYPR